MVPARDGSSSPSTSASRCVLLMCPINTRSLASKRDTPIPPSLPRDVHGVRDVVGRIGLTSPKRLPLVSSIHAHFVTMSLNPLPYKCQTANTAEQWGDRR